ncbi:MAG: C1 family peptidase [Spirosomataceae bacterium]
MDLSPYVPSVIDQGNLGTCVGVSTTYYMRTIMEAYRLGITNKDSIDALRYSPSFLYNAIKGKTDVHCQQGTQIEAALEYLKNNGVARFSEQGYPHCVTNKPLTISASSKILDFVKLFGFNFLEENKVPAMKKALAEGSPVIVGIHTTNSLERLGNNIFWKKLWRQICAFLVSKPCKKWGFGNPKNREVYAQAMQYVW